MSGKDDPTRRRPPEEEEHGPKGQYGGLERGLGYGGGRDIEDAERPAKPEKDEKRRER